MCAGCSGPQWRGWGSLRGRSCRAVHTLGISRAPPGDNSSHQEASREPAKPEAFGGCWQFPKQTYGRQGGCACIRGFLGFHGLLGGVHLGVVVHRCLTADSCRGAVRCGRGARAVQPLPFMLSPPGGELGQGSWTQRQLRQGGRRPHAGHAARISRVQYPMASGTPGGGGGGLLSHAKGHVALSSNRPFAKGAEGRVRLLTNLSCDLRVLRVVLTSPQPTTHT